jgi:uncharacterized LabA/DUF88 family protein
LLRAFRFGGARDVINFFNEMKNLVADVQNTFSLAVLIDADNAQPKIIPGLLAAIAKLGNASVKRIYGDWTKPNLGHWKDILLEHAIQPIQQFAYTSGKNATDSAMIIDAMDLLYTGPFQGFCVVSSDSDFTRLAARIRESGKRVYGFGERKTPRPFVVACDKFVCTEDLEAQDEAVVEVKSGQKNLEKPDKDARLIQLMRSAIKEVSDDTGWACLSGVGSNIKKVDMNFNPKSYGYKKLSDLADAMGLFEIDKMDKRVFIRNGNAKKMVLPG